MTDGVKDVTTCTEFHEAGCSCPRRDWSPNARNCSNWRKRDVSGLPGTIFVTSLHGMFLAVVRARKLKEDESGLLFPAPARHEKRDTYPWHQLQLPRPRGIPPKIPVIGQLPKEWKWGPNLLPMVLRWHAELEWLKMPPALEHIPRAHWQVSFMELALDFEAFAGRPLPPAPQFKFVGGDMSLQEKGRVL